MPIPQHRDRSLGHPRPAAFLPGPSRYLAQQRTPKVLHRHFAGFAFSDWTRWQACKPSRHDRLSRREEVRVDLMRDVNLEYKEV